MAAPPFNAQPSVRGRFRARAAPGSFRMASLHDRLLVIDGLVFHSDGDPR